MNNTLPAPQCTCPENAHSLSQLCETCLAEYEQWLCEEAAAAATETRQLGSEQLLALAGELFKEAEELHIPQLQCRVRKLNAELWSAA